MEENPTPNRIAVLQETKLEREISKLEIETRELSRKWYEKVSFYATIIPALVTIILLFFGFKTDYIQLKLESIAQKTEKLDEIEKNSTQKQKELSMLDSILIQRADSLRIFQNSVDSKSAILFELEEKNKIRNDSLIIRAKRLQQEEISLSKEEHIASAKHYLKSIIDQKGRLSFSDENALSDLLKSSDKAKAKYTDETLQEALKNGNLSPMIKGVIFKIYNDATSDRKWLDKLIELYKKEYKNVPTDFFSLFTHRQVIKPGTNQLDQHHKIDIVKTLNESIKYPGVSNWNKREIYYTINLVINEIWYDKEKFVRDNISSDYLKSMEKDLVFFINDIINNPKNHTDTIGEFVYAPNAYDIKAIEDLLLLLRSKHLPASIYAIYMKDNLREEEYLMFKPIIEHINQNLPSYSFGNCTLTTLPLNKESMADWKKENNCYFENIK